MLYNYPEVNFDVESKMHPNFKDLTDDALNWTLNIQLFENTKQLQRQIQAASVFVGRLFPTAPFTEKLLWINRISIVWLILDDIRDEKMTLDINSKEEDAEQIHFESILMVRETDRQTDHPVLKAYQSVLKWIKENSSKTWYNSFIDTLYQTSMFAHEDSFLTKSDEKPDFILASMRRPYISLMLPFLKFWEFAYDIYLSPSLESSFYFHQLFDAGMKVLYFYNDYIGSEKEMGSETANHVLYALKVSKSLSYQEAIWEMHKIILENLKVFNALSSKAEQFYEGDNLRGLKHYIECFKQSFQGNKDFTLKDCDRYYDNKVE